ncbi:twin-arginine translocase TatA/TatE family subunit [bacterium]|nr:twin-arginine translocase TatA/TatE family subunit [bacterium]|tara:strand:- start:9576 stop:9761 length:186 start_codon:yes stop_codon:yes gene_type:complete
MFGSNEIIVIAIIVLVLFGSAAIPKFAKSLGLAKKEFEKGLKEADDSTSETTKSSPDDSSK